MTKNWREDIAKSLHESFKHKYSDELICAICGKTKTKFAMNVIQYAQKIDKPLPEGFVPVSSSFGSIRGCFPVCDSCAPPCKSCGLPLPTKKVRTFYRAKKNELTGDVSVNYGNGICRDFHFKLFIEMLLFKLFKIQ